MMNISRISPSRISQKESATAYGLDKAFAVLFFEFVLLVITLEVKPNDLKDPPFCPYLRHLLTKLKNEKITTAKYQELSQTVVRIVGWEPQHPAKVKRDFQVFWHTRDEMRSKVK